MVCLVCIKHQSYFFHSTFCIAAFAPSHRCIKCRLAYNNIIHRVVYLERMNSNLRSWWLILFFNYDWLYCCLRSKNNHNDSVRIRKSYILWVQLVYKVLDWWSPPYSVPFANDWYSHSIYTQFIRFCWIFPLGSSIEEGCSDWWYKSLFLMWLTTWATPIILTCRTKYHFAESRWEWGHLKAYIYNLFFKKSPLNLSCFISIISRWQFWFDIVNILMKFGIVSNVDW